MSNPISTLALSTTDFADLASQEAAWLAAESTEFAPDTITDGWEWDDLADPLDYEPDFSDYDPVTMRRYW